MKRFLLATLIFASAAAPCHAQLLGNNADSWHNGADRHMNGRSRPNASANQWQNDLERKNDWQSDLSRHNGGSGLETQRFPKSPLQIEMENDPLNKKDTN